MRGDSTSKVSVIVPCYNVEEYLAQCLDSILGQTHGNLEVLCINDGSTDGTLAILRRYAREDERVRVIDKPNGGYGQGCNRGMREATGEWISIIEPDDWIEPRMYSDMLELADRSEGTVDVIKTPWYIELDWDDPAKASRIQCKLHRRIPTSARPFTLAEHGLLIEIHPGIWSALYRRSFLEEFSISFPEYPGAGWADNPFLVDTLCQARGILYLDEPFYHYRSDLEGSTLNHSSAGAIERPFDRWMDMTHLMERIGVHDPRIWYSHYLRGFNYIDGARYDDGETNELVLKKEYEVLGMMRPEYVLDNPKLNKHRKRVYMQAHGMDASRIPMKGRLRYILHEAIDEIRIGGLGYLWERVGILIFGAKKHPTDAA